ncbi:hypothetical protein [Rhodococcus qingshengii]|uniref:hypothetical protein n=1 Tax=Rhodococcus qingshengii TaxID=334542 RepID=UPI0022B3C8E0|nr:hypothetical protein [Rhodococcus qingshengii]MCZ4615198.1 hypothetical protein [Rhodococcus qingshengii]
MTAPYAKAVVTAELDWGNIGPEFERRVRIAAEKAATAAQRHFDRIKLAAKVTLNTDAALFRRETQQKLERILLSADVTLRANTSKFYTDVRNATKNLPNAKVGIDLDAGNIQSFVAGVETRLRAARITAPVFLAVANEADFLARIATLTRPVTQTVNIITTGDTNGPGGGPGSGNGVVGALRGGMIRRIRMQIEMDRASVESAQAQVNAIETQLTSARARQSESLDRVRLAQTRLDEVNANSNATTSQRIAAQNALSRANNDLGTRTTRVTQLVGDQADAHRRLQGSQQDQNSGSRLLRAGLGGLIETIRNATRENGGLSRSFGRVSMTGLKIGGISALIGAIGGAAGIAAGAVGALVAGLGAVGVAGAAGMATTLVGMKGIGDAFSAFSAESSSAGADAASRAKSIAAAQKGVEQANRGVEQANRGVESAERSVARANKESQNAQKDLTQAREDAVRQIEDLNFALKGTAIDERDAELALARARESYDKAFSDPKASALDRAEAALGVDKALRRQEETMRRNADIEKDAREASEKGVEQSDQVVAAKEKVIDAADRVKDAEQGVADAQVGVADAQQAVVEAQADLQEAMDSTSSAADKTAQALAKLSPNARAFVLAMRELGPEWEAVRKSVQDNMFAGLDVTFTNLAQTSMPMLKEGMGQVGTSINGAAKEFAAFWGSAGAQDSLRNIFAGTADLITAMQPGLAALTTGMLDIGNAAAPVMGQLGDSLGNLLGSIGEAFTEAFADGSLTELIGHFSTMMDGLGGGLNALLGGLIDFGNIVGPVLGPLLQTFGESIAMLAPSLGALGVSFGNALIEILPTLSEFISSLADGLAPVMPVIADLLKSLGAALTPLIPPLSRILQTVGTALVGAIDALAPAIGPLGEAFASLIDALAPILPMVAEVISVLVQALAPALKTIFDALGPVIKQWLDGMKPVLEQLAPILAEVAMQLGQAIADALIQLMPVLPTLIDSFSQIVLAIAPFIPQLVQIAAELLPKLIDVIVWLVNTILPPLTKAIVWIAEHVLPLVIEGIRNFAQTWGDRLTSAKNAMVDAKDRISEAVESIKGFFTGLGEKVSSVWGGIVNTIKGAVGAIGRFLKDLPEVKIPDIPGVPGRGTKIGFKDVGQAMVNWSQSKAAGGVVAGQRANGVLFGPGTGTSDDILGLSASGLPTARVAAGEMLVNKIQTDRNLPLLTAINAGWTPSPEMVRALVYGSGLPAHAGGGVVGSFKDLAAQHAPGLTLTSAERDTNDYHGQGKAVDYSNGSGNTDEQLAWANFLADNYQDQLSELIYSDPRFTRNIKDGKIVDPSFYGAATMAQHENHVHAAAQAPLGPPAQMSGDESGMDATPDTRTNKEKYVDEIISEGKRRGMSEKQIKAAIMTMLAESNGQMYANASDPESLNYAHDAVGSDHDSSGLFQQRNNGDWGTIADRMDPARSAGMFYEELTKIDESGKSEAQLAQAVQRSAFSDGSNYAAKESEAESLIAESNARGNGAAASGTETTAGAGSTQQVFVTNWPSGMGGSSSALTSAATAAAVSSGPSAPSPVVVSAAATTAFDPNNTGYDQSYYDDQVPRGGIDGANAWLARQDFTPQLRQLGIDMVKEVGGQFAEPLGLGNRWGEAVDQGAANAMRTANTGGGNTYITNEFHGYNGTPQQFIAEVERAARQGMVGLSPI